MATFRSGACMPRSADLAHARLAMRCRARLATCLWKRRCFWQPPPRCTRLPPERRCWAGLARSTAWWPCCAAPASMPPRTSRRPPAQRSSARRWLWVRLYRRCWSVSSLLAPNGAVPTCCGHSPSLRMCCNDHATRDISAPERHEERRHVYLSCIMPPMWEAWQHSALQPPLLTLRASLNLKAPSCQAEPLATPGNSWQLRRPPHLSQPVQLLPACPDRAQQPSKALPTRPERPPNLAGVQGSPSALLMA